MTSKKARLYESFNARNLTLKEVAETFVPPAEYEELWSTDHVLLMGPRGSGKTTLFKMLTHEALSSCDHPVTAQIQQEMKLAPVYIPTDRHWHHLLEESLAEVTSKEARLQLSKAAVAGNVLYSVVKAFEDLRDFAPKVELSPGAEGQLVRALGDTWSFSDILPRLGAVRRALTDRLHGLDKIKNKLAAGVLSEDELGLLPEEFWFEYLSAARVGCEAFGEFADGQIPRHWALCFDELELAPIWLQEQVFEYLRSTDQRFVFKLSTAPIPESLSESMAAASQDFRVVRLWRYKKSGDPYRFAEQLTRSVLSNRLDEQVEPSEVFGHSPFSSQRGERSAAYKKGGQVWKAMRSLAEKDQSFGEELERRGFSISDSWDFDITAENRNRFFRKAKPIVLLRDYYIKENDGKISSLRSRKVHSLYSGVEAIYDVADNNPRWLIGILNELVEKIEVTEEGNVKKVRRNVQARVLADAAGTFLALLKTLPSSRVTYKGHLLDLVDVLEAIGGYFRDVILRNEFSVDPAGSIAVDQDIPDPVRKLLQRAVYEGALVLVNPTEGAVDLTIAGRRLRLTHLLSPKYRLPFRLYGQVNLSTCLRETSRPVGEPLQPDLAWED